MYDTQKFKVILSPVSVKKFFYTTQRLKHMTLCLRSVLLEHTKLFLKKCLSYIVTSHLLGIKPGPHWC